MTKMIKKNVYEALVNYATTGFMAYSTEDGMIKVEAEDLKAFAENEIALLEKKAVKAKESAAKRRKEADALQMAVAEALGDEFEPIADIAARVEVEDATVAKCTYRLNALVEAGLAEKTDIKVPASEGKKARTIKGYRRVVTE